MNRHYYALAGVLLLAFISIGCTNSNASKKQEGGILGVADIQSDPSGVKGTVVVTGVVARVSGKEKQLFAIIDTDERNTASQQAARNSTFRFNSMGQSPRNGMK